MKTHKNKRSLGYLLGIVFNSFAWFYLFLFLIIKPGILTAQPSSGSLPKPWRSMDIGSPTLKGSASYDGDRFTLIGNGYMKATNDNFHYIYQRLRGDGQIVARLDAMQKAGWDNQGLMIRETLDPGSPYAMTSVNGNSKLFFMVREPDSTASRTDHVAIQVPVWLKLVKSGGVITTYHSADGSTWEKTHEHIVNFGDECYFGLAAFASRNNKSTKGVWSNVSVRTGPIAPSDLSASIIYPETIVLEWQDNSSDEIGFKVERSTDLVTGIFEEIRVVGSDSTSFTDTGLGIKDTTYLYRVWAFNAQGESEKQTVQVQLYPPELPVAPSNLSASVIYPGTIRLHWQDNSNTETGFKIERSTDLITGIFEEVAVLGFGSTSFFDTGLGVKDTTYLYKVWAYNPAGESEKLTIQVELVPQDTPVNSRISSTVLSDEPSMRAQALVVYPNTTEGHVTINLTSEITGLVEVTVSNMHGELVSSKFSQHADQLHVEFESPKGMYLIHVKTRQGVRRLKVLKE